MKLTSLCCSVFTKMMIRWGEATRSTLKNDSLEETPGKWREHVIGA